MQTRNICFIAVIAIEFFGFSTQSQGQSSPDQNSKAIPVVVNSAPAPLDIDLQPLFPKDGVVTEGWTVRRWNEVSKSPRKPVSWEVKDGVLYGTGGLPDDQWIGTWLLSEKEYENFIIDFEFHLGKDWGNGGLALRAPLSGDPAFEGMELQMTEPKYQLSMFPDATPAQLTGGIYLAIAPKELAYRTGEWNHLRKQVIGTVT